MEVKGFLEAVTSWPSASDAPDSHSQVLLFLYQPLDTIYHQSPLPPLSDQQLEEHFELGERSAMSPWSEKDIGW